MKTLNNTLGFSLLEMMVSVLIITIVVGILSSMAIALGDTARSQEIRGMSADEARKGMIYIVRDLRQAGAGTLAGAPGDTITYRTAGDVDGNGTAVDVNGNLELGPLITVGRDVNDLNNDGLTDDQLIWSNGTEHLVRANGLLPNEDLNNNGVLDSGEDTNFNGRLDRGVWFERNGNIVELFIQTGGADRRQRFYTVDLHELVRMRN